MSSSPAPGWYPDPRDDSRQRWWDGGGWTEHTQAPAATPPAFGREPEPVAGGDRTMAMLAHLLAIPSAFIVLAFVGPLLVYLVRQDDPYVRANAAEATNFQLSNLLWLAISGVIFPVVLVLTLGLAVLAIVPIYVIWAIVWLWVVIRAALRASAGKPYRYPFTLRLVS